MVSETGNMVLEKGIGVAPTRKKCGQPLGAESRPPTPVYRVDPRVVVKPGVKWSSGLFRITRSDGQHAPLPGPFS